MATGESGSGPLDASTPFVVGRVVKAHGLRGAVVVAPATPGSDVLLGVDEVTLEHGGKRRRAKVTAAAPQGTAIRLSLDGVADRNQAEALVGATLWLTRAELPEPDDDSVYLADLAEWPVVAKDGSPLGRVVDLETAPGQDWLVVERDGKRHLVPFAAPLVQVDEDAGKVVVDAPEGLFDLE